MKKFSFIKMIKLNKQPKRSYLLKQIALLSATGIILILAVFAWFTSKEDAEASGINVTMSSNNNLLISLNDGAEGSFVNGIDLLDPDVQQYISLDNQILNKLVMKDITSDGKTFYRPVFLDDANNRTPDTTRNWDTVTGNNSVYISEKITFRTTVPSDIYIGANTSIITSAEKDGLLLSNSEPVGIGNKSGFGNFSKDCIVGALRISAINSDGDLCYVMIPRKDIEITKTIVSETASTYSLVTGESVSNNTKVHEYYTSSSDLQGSGNYYIKATADNVIDAFSTSESPIATTTLKENGFYEATATVNIWLEGCDPETTRALSGGKYTISLDFVAEENNQSSTPAE